MIPSLQIKKPRPRRSHRHVPEGFQFLLEGNPHPLLIPCIVGEVASYLPVSDLKSFRQVCTQWNEEACKELRQKGKIILHGEANLIAYTRLLSAISSSHTNFELRGDLELGSAAVQKFFETFGPKVKYICFNRVKWKEAELKDLLFQKLPNLEELGLEARAYSDRRLFPNGIETLDDNSNVAVVSCSQSPPSGSVEAILPRIRILRLNIFSLMTEGTTPFLRDVLRASPNVEVISSLKTSSISNPLPMPFIQYICQATNYDTADDLVHMPYAADIAIAEAIIETKGLKLSKLRDLECTLRLRTHGLNQLALKGFPLQQLDLTVMSDVTSGTLLNMLHSVQDSLKVLKLKFQPGCPAAKVFLTPHLSRLTSLTLNGYSSSLKILEQMPNLLELEFIRINLQSALAKEAVQCTRPLRIQSFRVLEELGDRVAGVTVRLLAVLLPKVKKLKLENLCDESLVEVFAEFRHLEELDALNGLYGDCGVTGIKKSLLSATQQNPLNTPELWRFKEKPEISCLKNIRNLSLGSPKLTDSSILYGVSLCKSLRRLHLLSYQITDISLLRLCRDLDLYYLKTEYCFQLTTDAVAQAKEMMKGRTLSLNEYNGPMKQSEIPKFMRRNGNVSVRLNKLEVTSHQPAPSTSLPTLLATGPLASCILSSTEAADVDIGSLSAS